MKKIVYFFLVVTFEIGCATIPNKKKRGCFTFNSLGLCITACKEEPLDCYIPQESLGLPGSTTARTTHEEEPHVEEEEDLEEESEQQDTGEDTVTCVFEEDKENKKAKKRVPKRRKKSTLLGYVLSQFFWSGAC